MVVAAAPELRVAGVRVALTRVRTVHIANRPAIEDLLQLNHSTVVPHVVRWVQSDVHWVSSHIQLCEGVAQVSSASKELHDASISRSAQRGLSNLLLNGLLLLIIRQGGYRHWDIPHSVGVAMLPGQAIGLTQLL